MKNKPSKPNQLAVPDKAAIKKAKAKENREKSKGSMMPQERWPRKSRTLIIQPNLLTILGLGYREDGDYLNQVPLPVRSSD